MQMSMVLRDQALKQMSYEDWQTAVIPKVTGTWNVHEATKDHKLDFFVLFSSASGTIGQSGQANYAASNTFQDAFVQYRQSLGLAASVLDIGVVEDIGYVSENPQFLESLRAAAFHLLSETDLLECLQLIMSRSFLSTPLRRPSRTEGYINPAHLVICLKTPLPLADPNNRSIWKRDPRMAAYRDSSDLAPAQSSGTDEVLQRFLMTATLALPSLTGDETLKFLSEQIERRVLGFLMITDRYLDKTITLNDVGIDSLVAIELRNWWKQNLSSEISVLELLNASLEQLGRIAGERLPEKLEESSGGPTGSANITATTTASVNGNANGQYVPVASEEGKVSDAEYILMKSLQRRLEGFLG